MTDNMDNAESYLRYVVQYVLDNCQEELDLFNRFVEKGLIEKLQGLVTNPFERLTYTEAVAILEKCGKKFEYAVEWGIDLQSEHERYLTEERFKKPVILTDYPARIKAFYMRGNDDQKTVAAMDILVPGIGELVGGSQREERYDVLLEKIRANKLDEKTYWWYLELRKYGTVPHSGYGVGFERLVQFATGMENIRDVIPFPRTPGHAEF
jgi:asparaginyl-tRNA synthetase